MWRHAHSLPSASPAWRPLRFVFFDDATKWTLTRHKMPLTSGKGSGLVNELGRGRLLSYNVRDATVWGMHALTPNRTRASTLHTATRLPAYERPNPPAHTPSLRKLIASRHGPILRRPPPPAPDHHRHNAGGNNPHNGACCDERAPAAVTRPIMAHHRRDTARKGRSPSGRGDTREAEPQRLHSSAIGE